MSNTIVGRLALVLLASTILASCVSQSSYTDLKEQYDSIAMANQEIENDFYQTDSLVASVLSQFQEIGHIENMINVNIPASESPRNEQRRIRDNMKLIYERLDKSSEIINDLTKQIESKGKANVRLLSTLSILRLQIEQQREHTKQYEQEVDTRWGLIRRLEHRMNSLKDEMRRIRRDQELYDELLNAREREQNTVRYCIGSSRDLRDMGILRGKQVSIQDAKLDYLTRADQMQLRELPLEATKAKLLSIHPSNTYQLVPSDKKQLTLEILDLEGFWAYSRILIIEVE